MLIDYNVCVIKSFGDVNFKFEEILSILSSSF